MALPIAPISPAVVPSIDPGAITAGGSKAGAGNFQSALSSALSDVQHFRENSQHTIDNFLSGGGQDLHQVALATQQSELAFELFVQVRNKVVSAYQEIMRMQM